MNCKNCEYNRNRKEINGSEVICPAAHVKVIVLKNICVTREVKK